MSLARLTQLFAEGAELVLETPSNEKIPIWIAKLNAFEEEQANQAGRVARARLINAIKDIGTPEFDVVQASKARASKVVMAEAILQSKEAPLFIEAMNDLRSDEQWRERIEIMEFSEAETLDGVELQAHRKITAEFNAELLRRQKERLDDVRHDLREMSRADLEEQYEEAYLEQQGLAAFGIERARQHLYLAMRRCEATVPAEGEPWSHADCDHQRMFLADPREVDRLPQPVRDKVENAYAQITIAPSMARFTDALASSSASPEPSAKEEDSTPSGPEATSDVPATT